MKTISQVAKITGISKRTLQYYDEINLLKPSKLSTSHYRLYDDIALQKLQQILFFKELGFSLKEIKDIMQAPEFDKLKAFSKQKELLLLKRNRTDRLIQLLTKLEKGESCMSFKEFDLSDYIEALECFKHQNTEDIIKHWGSVEHFNLFIEKIKESESDVAKLAIKQFGSIEKYTEAMKYNMKHFSEIMEQHQINTQDLVQKSDALYAELTSNLQRQVSSPEVQDTVHELISLTQKNTLGSNMGDGFWDMLIESYSNDLIKSVNDKKYGAGASDYIASALRYYVQNTLKHS